MPPMKNLFYSTPVIAASSFCCGFGLTFLALNPDQGNALIAFTTIVCSTPMVWFGTRFILRWMGYPA